MVYCMESIGTDGVPIHRGHPVDYRTVYNTATIPKLALIKLKKCLAAK